MISKGSSNTEDWHDDVDNLKKYRTENSFNIFTILVLLYIR